MSGGLESDRGGVTMTAPRRRSPHKNIRGWVERPDRGQQRQQHAPSPTQYLANERDGERGAGSASESRGARRRCLPSPSPSPSQVRTGNPTGRRWTPGRSSQPCRSRCSTRPPRPPSLRSRTTLPRSLSLPQTPQTSQTSQTSQLTTGGTPRGSAMPASPLPASNTTTRTGNCPWPSCPKPR